MTPEQKPWQNQTRRRLKGLGSPGKPSKTVVTGMHTELRAHILIFLNERIASRPEICKELGAPLNKVRHEMEVLKKTDPPLIELVYEKPVRGTVEKFYRATAMAYIDPSEWPGVPNAVKLGMRGSLLEILVDDAVAAVGSGTYDDMAPAGHMSWTPMILDDKGQEDVFAALLTALERVVEIKEESAERLLAKDAKGKSCTVSILGYASANEDRKAGPSRDVSDLEVLSDRRTNEKRTSKRSAKKRQPAKEKGKTSGGNAKTKKAKGPAQNRRK
jgi:hypothetical protein